MELKLPFKTWMVEGVKRASVTIENGIASISMKKGETVVFKNGYE
ncbi:MAG: hypothetical protein WDM90_21380 [Ferruginibacter sp.]